ncbi:hypothetical protein J2809_004190 [Arthrobacter pascens]|uniref:hypothetical protein n=1 Tax=Arthrobacter pascens TaxID=1677 RepID=UPI0028558D5E|nr:hypothetical protein [Arthrobacter pascens]MDR6559807.1 hypothetical protein [Arthrobacter pascens]
MKRIEASRIHNSQRIHALANNAGPAAIQEFKPTTPTDDHWAQDLWPDCSD